jgi:serine/threonine protein kinase
MGGREPGEILSVNAWHGGREKKAFSWISGRDIFTETIMIGSTVSHYRILEKLGGMRVVYLAEDQRLGRRVAIKFLPEQFADAATRERFHWEARAASAPNHPNICVLHDIGEREGQPFLVMDYMEGSTLKHHIGGKPLPQTTVLDYSLQIAEGPTAAQAKNIVHRDLKPANVFVTSDGVAGGQQAASGPK